MNAPCFIQDVVIPEMERLEQRSAVAEQRFQDCRADTVTNIKTAIESGKQLSLFGSERSPSIAVADFINTESIAWLIDRSFKAKTEEEITSAAMLLIDTAIFEVADAHAEWFCFERKQ